MLAGSGNAKKERGNGVLDIWLGNDVTLQNNSEATMLSKLDEGTDVTLQKMSQATMPPMRCAPAKNEAEVLFGTYYSIALCHAKNDRARGCSKKNSKFLKF